MTRYLARVGVRVNLNPYMHVRKQVTKRFHDYIDVYPEDKGET